MAALHYGMLKLSVCCSLAVLLSAPIAMPQADRSKAVRARDLGVPFDGAPGPFNAITDVPGVEVGFTTLIRGDGPLNVGEGPVRTGVTAILPRGSSDTHPAYAGWFSLNGNGEMTGTAWIEESGLLEGPIGITNTHSVGVVRDTTIKWLLSHHMSRQPWALPVVAETWDGWLNDLNGFHVKPEHVIAALDSAKSGPVAEGNTGGGTGMICYGFKGGTGTSSRVLVAEDGGYIVGVLVQCNCGTRRLLTIAGVPVGREIPIEPRHAAANAPGSDSRGDVGSIIIVIATNAPLLPHQLKRIARRASLGLARTGSISGNGSGDLFLASPRPTPTLTTRRGQTRLPRFRMTRSVPSLKQPSRPLRKPSSTPWSAPKP